MYWATAEQEEEVKLNVDRFGDSYARNATTDELDGVCDSVFILTKADKNTNRASSDTQADGKGSPHQRA